MRDRAYCGLFGALALALPAFFHAVGLAGPLFLPMYWPLVALAFLVRTRCAVVTAAVVPLASSVMTGMPLLWPPLAAALSLELALQVAALGLFRYGSASPIGARRVFCALLMVLPLGRLLHAALLYLLSFRFQLPAAAISTFAFAAGWPGVLAMLLVVPAFVGSASRRDGVCEVRFLKALRRLRLPEGFVLVSAQTLRWFEALAQDAEQIARALELRRVRPSRGVEPGVPAVECRRFEVVYPGASEPALSLTSFVVAQGEKVALLGPNGCGKTSLLAALVGYAPWNGEVKVFGDVPRGRTLSLVRSHAGCLFDDPDAQFLFPTVREDVAHALGRRDDAKVDALLDSVGLGPGNRPVATLSRGQRQRAALAGVLAAEPPLLLLDEPTAALDDREKARLAALLAALPAAVVVATHDRAFAAALGARIEELGR